MLRKWPNDANRTVYPSPIGLSATPITKPRPLDQEVVDRYEAYTKEYKSLSEKKQALEEKSEKLIKQLETAEGVKGNAWSRKDHGLIKRLTSETEDMKLEILAAEKKLDILIALNGTLLSVVSMHESCVRGYEDYLVWKEESTRYINETFN